MILRNNDQTFCAVDCKWGSWSTEGKCSVTCGSGMRVQRRSVVTKAQNGGSRCKGKAIKLQKCNLPPCQGKCTFQYVSGKFFW